MVTLPYFENVIFIQNFFPIWNSIYLYIIGITILILGGVILISSRLMIGRFGSSKITLENNHRIITKGIYGYIRHPLYLGMLLVFFGVWLTLVLIAPLTFY